MMPAVVVGVNRHCVVVLTAIGSVLRLTPHQKTRQFCMAATAHMPLSSMRIVEHCRVDGFVFF